MTQIITTPDGVEHEFPDSASDDVIKNALKSYSSGSAKQQSPPGYQSPDWLPGAGYLHKLSTIYDDAATGGWADTATAKVGDLLRRAGIGNATPDVETLRAQTEQSRKDVGPIAAGLTDVAGYTTGLGKLGAGEQIAGRLGGGLAARVGGSAAEGALASGIGTVGHGDTDLKDIGKSMSVGGLIGAATGALPGGRGAAPTTPSTADLQTTAKGLFAPLSGKGYNAADVGNALDRVTSGLSAGDAVSLGPRLAEARDLITKEIGNRTSVTADDIVKFQRQLKSAAGGDDNAQRIAQRYVDTLNKGVGPNTAADIAAANRASNIAKTSSDIEDWMTTPSKAPSAVKRALENRPDLYQTQPGLFDVLKEVGQKAPSAEPSVSNEVSKALVKHLGGMVAGGAAGYLLGNNPYGDVAGVIAGAAAPWAAGKVLAIPIKNSLLAARHLNATGMKVDPGVYTPRALQIPGALARQTGYGLGAAGLY